MRRIFRNQRFRVIFIMVSLLFMCTSVYAIDTNGQIIINSIDGETPNIAPPGLPTNMLFILDNNKYNPTQNAGNIAPALITPQMYQGDYTYDFNVVGTVNMLVKKVNTYGRTNVGKNKNKVGLPIESMYIPGGGNYKAFIVDHIDKYYNMEAPPAPPIVGEHEGYDPDLRPLLRVAINNYSHPNHELSAPNYRYEVYDKAVPGNLIDSAEINATEWRPDETLFDPIQAPKIFVFKVSAHNWYGFSDPVTQIEVDVPALEGGVAQIDPGTITLSNGINFISMPFNRKADGTIEWFAYDGAAPNPPINVNGTNKIETPRDLIKIINEFAKPNANGQNVVSTFGRWVQEGQGSSDKGKLIPDAGGIIKNIDAIANDANDPNGVLDKPALLRSEEGYQVYISGLTVDTIEFKIYPNLIQP